MKIEVKYVRTDIHIVYKPEYTGFVLWCKRDGRTNSVVIPGSEFWTIERLERVVKWYSEIL
jgi:hypothetical protein